MARAQRRVVNVYPKVGGITTATCPDCGSATPVPADVRPMASWAGICLRGHRARYRLMPEPEVAREVQEAAEQLMTRFGKAELAQIARLISPAPRNAEMTPEEFEEFRAHVLAAQAGKRGRPITEETLNTAREIMVMGASPTEIARIQNKSRAAVSAMMSRIRAYRHSLAGHKS